MCPGTRITSSFVLALFATSCGSTGSGADAALPSDSAAALDLLAPPVSEWALYTIKPGGHGALLTPGTAGNPLSGLVNGVAGRDFDFVFDPSAIYTITMPTQPGDQLDWNKLPGISDCAQLDLSVDGVMFGWRWRLDTTPNVLEVTAYANDASNHLWPQTPLFQLDANDLASLTPLHYRLWIDGASYRFTVGGTIRGRSIDASATLSRQCASTPANGNEFQWASGFYFGGTSSAPSTITGRIFEHPFP